MCPENPSSLVQESFLVDWNYIGSQKSWILHLQNNVSRESCVASCLGFSLSWMHSVGVPEVQDPPCVYFLEDPQCAIVPRLAMAYSTTKCVWMHQSLLHVQVINEFLFVSNSIKGGSADSGMIRAEGRIPDGTNVGMLGWSILGLSDTCRQY